MFLKKKIISSIEKQNECIKKIMPSYIDITNTRYIVIDDIYFTHLLVVDYARIHTELLLEQIMSDISNVNISIFYEKQKTAKTIRDLTYHIGDVSTSIKDVGPNVQDIDVKVSALQDAKYIRKEMGINKEEMFYLHIYICIYDKNLDNLNSEVDKIETLLLSKGLYTRKANFRQTQSYLSCMPFMQNNVDIKQVTARNILTNGLVATYPFISSQIYDEKGILFGINQTNNSLTIIDLFDDKKYKNANVCIFGTSGSGKSYFTKLLILRNYYVSLNQFIIDPDREYLSLSEKLQGTIVKIGPGHSTYINILDIRKESIDYDEGGGFLENKINMLMEFFNLILKDITLEQKSFLQDKIIECYNLKGIYFDDESLYNLDVNNVKPNFKCPKQMPILEDLYNILKKDKKTNSIATKLKPLINGSLKFLNNYTNINLQNKLIVIDIYDLKKEIMPIGMYAIIDLLWDKIKKDRTKKKAIYLDEVWKLIGNFSNPILASFVQNIFKTIRKYKGAAIAVTQDVSDLFSLENGKYGNSLITNSNVKIAFSLEEQNIGILGKYINLSEKEKIILKTLSKGEAWICAENNRAILTIEANDKESQVISI